MKKNVLGIRCPRGLTSVMEVVIAELFPHLEVIFKRWARPAFIACTAPHHLGPIHSCKSSFLASNQSNVTRNIKCYRDRIWCKGSWVSAQENSCVVWEWSQDFFEPQHPLLKNGELQYLPSQGDHVLIREQGKWNKYQLLLTTFTSCPAAALLASIVSVGLQEIRTDCYALFPKLSQLWDLLETGLTPAVLLTGFAHFQKNKLGQLLNTSKI